MQSNKRPTPKELGHKLKEARRIVQDNPAEIVIVDVFKWDQEWERLASKLGLLCQEVVLIGERIRIVANCLVEVSFENHHWRGRRMYCNRPGFSEVELWEFKWKSRCYQGIDLYIKFGFKHGKLCFLSFHPDEPDRIVMRK